jgi:hypothetical protein
MRKLSGYGAIYRWFETRPFFFCIYLCTTLYHYVTPKKPRANTELVGLALRSNARLGMYFYIFSGLFSAMSGAPIGVNRVSTSRAGEIQSFGGKTRIYGVPVKFKKAFPEQCYFV